MLLFCIIFTDFFPLFSVHHTIFFFVKQQNNSKNITVQKNDLDENKIKYYFTPIHYKIFFSICILRPSMFFLSKLIILKVRKLRNTLNTLQQRIQ